MGGENLRIVEYPLILNGSSPRGRGKQGRVHARPQARRLIPAWAGKTRGPWPLGSRRPAHPRVGGENDGQRNQRVPAPGSSPRGRGKHGQGDLKRKNQRLIPAWAGKTFQRRLHQQSRPAHPRVGGENDFDIERLASALGSSPRGRGKHFLTCAFIERIGQILETLELAVSSESYTLSAAYATDAPQDQARNTGLALPSSRAAS